MKKAAIIIGLLVTCQSLILAQGNKHEIIVGYGTIIHYDVKEVTVNLAVTIVTVGYVNTVYKNGSGTFLFGYRYSPVERISIGVDGGYHKISEEAWSQDDYLGNLNRQYFIMAALANFKYVNKPSFQMYSGLAFGYAFQKAQYLPVEGEEDFEDAGQLAFHISALGFRFGKKIGGFAEIGYGYKGVVNFGLSVKL